MTVDFFAYSHAQIVSVSIPAKDPKIKVNIDVSVNRNTYLGDQSSLNQTKALIDEPYQLGQWDIQVKRTNPFEQITMDHILNRAFFKLWEILWEFNLIDDRIHFRSAHLCEGPGGFIQATQRYRDFVMDSFTVYDEHHAITLVPDRHTTKYVPQFSRKDFIAHTGADGTGNLYFARNVRNFIERVGKVALVTADGGFDASDDFNSHESNMARLLWCQIVAGLGVCENGGSFVIKFFDISTTLTARLIHLLAVYFDCVYLYKPNTSRPCNSEKYVVCTGFRGVKPEHLKQYLTIIDGWYSVKNVGLNLTDLLEDPIPDDVLRCIKYFNDTWIPKQIHRIQITLQQDPEHDVNLIKEQLKVSRSYKRYYHL